MALIVRVKPQSGDTSIRDIVSGNTFSGSGTATLTDVGPEKAWNIAADSLFTYPTTAKSIDGTVVNGGATIAMRFKVNTLGSDSFAAYSGVGSVTAGLRFTRNGENARARIGTLATTNTSGVAFTSNIVTLVYRITTSPESSADFGAMWAGGMSRVGTDPNFTSVMTNVTTTSIKDVFISAATSQNYDLLDFAYFDEELSNSDCASLADDIVGYFSDEPVTTPISFTGNIANKSFTAGDSVNIDLSANWSGTQTPFAFALTSGSLSGTGLTLSSAGVLSGTATESTVTGLVITGTDTDTNTAVSNSFSITISTVEPAPPTGTVTIGSITVGETTATIPFTYSAADQTGFEYRIDSGSVIAIANSPISLAGLTANTNYSVEVRAVNGDGAGTWSALSNFTTEATPVLNATLTSEPLKDNTGTLLANAPLDYVSVYDNATGELVLRVTGLSTNSSGVFSIENAALTSGVVYKLDWKITSQTVGRMPTKAAV